MVIRLKYRKIILVGVILFFKALPSFSQTSASATLNVYLADVRSIKVNPAQSIVTLNFATAADYSNGVSLSQPGHLEVTSTSGYVVKVKSSASYLQKGSDAIQVSTITLTPTISATNSSGTNGASNLQSLVADTYLYSTKLAVTPKVMIDASKGASRTLFDVKYQASGGTEYMNKATGNYSVTITYTIEPQ
jgi:hypothetical protein